jgi:hypothetical protein
MKRMMAPSRTAFWQVPSALVGNRPATGRKAWVWSAEEAEFLGRLVEFRSGRSSI